MSGLPVASLWSGTASGAGYLFDRSGALRMYGQATVREGKAASAGPVQSAGTSSLYVDDLDADERLFPFHPSVVPWRYRVGVARRQSNLAPIVHAHHHCSL